MDFDATAVVWFYVESSSGSHNFYRNQTGAIEAVAATVFGVAHVGKNRSSSWWRPHVWHGAHRPATKQALCSSTCLANRVSMEHDEKKAQSQRWWAILGASYISPPPSNKENRA